MKKALAFIGIVFVVILLLYAASKITPPQNINPSQPVACTMEAKLCPDGSSVGRTGPNCEFAACPEAPADNALESGSVSNMKTMQSGSITFSYPTTLPTTYITAQEWPPTLTLLDEMKTCPTALHSIGDSSYCLESSTEGAAGSIYTHYTYTKLYKDPAKSVSIDLTLRAVQCANYDDPKKTACEKEQTEFNLDSIIDQIFTSIEFERP